jgi:hypothetical protein
MRSPKQSALLLPLETPPDEQTLDEQTLATGETPGTGTPLLQPPSPGRAIMLETADGSI